MQIRTSALRQSRLLALVMAWVALAIGTLGLAGWVMRIRTLKTAFVGNVTMKANAAIALSTMALVLWALVPRCRARKRLLLVDGASVFVAALGIATLSQHLFGYNLGIDQLLFHEAPGEAATASPGRMGPPASLSFTFLGIGALCLARGSARKIEIAQWLALATLPLPLLALIGYATDARQLYGMAAYTGIALHTATAILLLGIGLFLARAERGPASLLVADNPGGEVARTMLPVAVLLPMALGWLRMEGQRRRLYHQDFGRALLLLALIVVLTAVVWGVSRRLALVARERASAELASTRARAEARRLEAENVHTLGLLEALLAHAPIGLVFLDRAHRCVRINDFLSRTLADEIRPGVGQDLHQILPGADSTLGTAIEAAFLHGTSTVDVEMNVTQGSESERSWLAGIFPVPEVAGNPALCGVVLMEITERKRLEAQKAMLLDSERAARVEAERAATLKDQFLATLSHELRTPLNSILGWTRLALQSPNNPPQLVRPLETIERNARVQAKLIEDLLDISRIASGKLRLSKEPVDLPSVVQAAVNAATPSANAKQIRVELEVEPFVPPLIGDTARLQQAVSNLLSNAIKFTSSEGRVVLHVARRDRYVELGVSDDGAGIAPEFLPHVFDRFRQADASTTRHHGGLGLGLAIVKQLTELHGGFVSVHSPGRLGGATFLISIPLDQEEEPPLSLENADWRRSDVSLDGIRVLVVDDEPDARELLGRILMEANANVKLAANADEALAIIDQDPEYIVVSDIGMPGRDGFDLIRALRQRFDARTLPAIAVTAFARAEDKSRALDAGFQVHVTKPVDANEMTLAVARLAGRSAPPQPESSVGRDRALA